MSQVAEQLRAARERQKLTIAKVAEATKIRTDHLRALEDGNFEVFSAPVYIRGFVRNYARFLKLDLSQIATALDLELSETEKFKEPPPLMDTPHTWVDELMFVLSKFDWRKGMVGLGAVAVVLVVVMAGVAWQHHRRADSLAGLPPGVYQPASSGDTLPLPKR